MKIINQNNENLVNISEDIFASSYKGSRRINFYENTKPSQTFGSDGYSVPANKDKKLKNLFLSVYFYQNGNLLQHTYTRDLEYYNQGSLFAENQTIKIPDIGGLFSDSRFNPNEEYESIFQIKQPLFDIDLSNFYSNERSPISIKRISPDRSYADITWNANATEGIKQYFMPLRDSEDDLTKETISLYDTDLTLSEFKDVLDITVKNIITKNINSLKNKKKLDTTFKNILQALNKVKGFSRLPESNFSTLFLEEYEEDGGYVSYTEKIDIDKLFNSISLIFLRLKERIENILSRYEVKYIDYEEQVSLITEQLNNDIVYLFAGEDAFDLAYNLIENYTSMEPELQELPAEIQSKINLLNRKKYIKLYVSKDSNVNETTRIPSVNLLPGLTQDNTDDTSYFGEGYNVKIELDTFKKDTISSTNEFITTTLFESILTPLLEEYDSIFNTKVDNVTNNTDNLNYRLINTEDEQQIIYKMRLVKDSLTNTYAIRLYFVDALNNNFVDNEPVIITRHYDDILHKLSYSVDEEVEEIYELRPSGVERNQENSTTTHLKNLQTLTANTGSNLTTQQLIDKHVNSIYKESSKLHFDFTDFEEFIKYGSAKERLLNFELKMQLLEDFNSEVESLINNNSINDPTTQVYKEYNTLLEKKENIITSFDNYENYLYTNSSVFGWPKTGNVNKEYTQAVVDSNWIKLKDNAETFDASNLNSLYNTLPHYIVETDENKDYITFIYLIGYQFDILWAYIKSLSKINSTYESKELGVPTGLIYDVVRKFGFDVANKNEIASILESLVGDNLEQNIREYSDEVNRRFIANGVYILKQKGTLRAIRSLLNTYGLPSYLVSVYEGGVNNDNIKAAVNEVQYESENYALHIYPSSSLIIPWGDETIPASLQLRFKTGKKLTESRILARKNNDFFIELNLDGNDRTIKVRNSIGETVISTEEINLDNNEWYNVTLTNLSGNVGLHVTQVENGTFYTVYDSIRNENAYINVDWNKTGSLYIGDNAGTGLEWFTGSVDEVRLWDIELNSNAIKTHAYLPESTAGNTINDMVSGALLFRFACDDISMKSINTQQTGSNLGSQEYASEYYLNNFVTSSVVPYFTYEYNTFAMPTFGLETQYTNGVYTSENNINSTNLSNNSSIINQLNTYDIDNTLHVKINPTVLINQEIFKKMPYFVLDDYIGDTLETGDDYDKLLDLKYLFFNNNNKMDISPRRMMKFVRMIDNMFFRQIEKLIPARTEYRKGYTVEPHMLERHKFDKLNVSIKKNNNTLNKSINVLKTLSTVSNKKTFNTTVNQNYNVSAIATLSVSSNTTIIDRINGVKAFFRSNMINSGIPFTHTHNPSTVDGAFTILQSSKPRIVKESGKLAVLPAAPSPLSITSLIRKPGTNDFKINWAGGVGPYVVEIFGSSMVNLLQRYLTKENDFLIKDPTIRWSVGTGDTLNIKISDFDGTFVETETAALT